jgi:hypothetical protein
LTDPAGAESYAANWLLNSTVEICRHWYKSQGHSADVEKE